jgi:hypothetical protein
MIFRKEQFMTEILLFIAVFTAGAVTALIYLYLLDLSVKKIMKDKNFSIFTLAGFILRIFICCSCFFLCSWDGRLDRLAVSLAGFFIVRIIALKYIKFIPDIKKTDGEK